MISSTLGGVIVLAQAFLGMHGHDAPRPGCCDVCGVRQAAVLAEITRLQTCPNWRKRDDAAHALRKVDWHCHPEVVDALAYSLLRDCEEEVREEAAETLAKLAPCTPVAHQALTQAADCDPDHATRKWARRALKAMAGRCEAPCQVCGPTPGGFAVSPQVVAPTEFPRTRSWHPARFSCRNPAGRSSPRRRSIRPSSLPRTPPCSEATRGGQAPQARGVHRGGAARTSRPSCSVLRRDRRRAADPSTRARRTSAGSDQRCKAPREMAAGSLAILSANFRNEARMGLTPAITSLAETESRLRLSYSSALGHELLEAAVGVEPTPAVGEGAGQQADIGRDPIHPDEGLTEVGRRQEVRRRAEVLHERREVGQPGVEPRRGLARSARRPT